MSASRRRLLLAGAAVAALLVIARLTAVGYSEYAWYEAQGAAALWKASVVNSVLLMGSAWLVGALFVFANLYVVLRSVRHLIVARQVANIEIEAAVPSRFLLAAAVVASTAVGGLLMLIQSDWTVLAVASYVPAFGVREPSLDTDVAFWVARLPLERAWYTWAQSALVAVATMVVILYALTRSLRWTPRGLHAATYVRRHISVLGALLLLLLAWGYRLERVLLPVNLGPDGYFGVVEQRMLTVLLVLAIFTAASAVLVLWAGYVGQTRIAFVTVTAIVLAALVLQQGGPTLIRWSAGEELDTPGRTLPYMTTQASFTRIAYGLPEHIPEDMTQRVANLPGLERAVALWDPAAVVAAVERGGRRRDVIGRIGWTRDSTGLAAVVVARDDAGEAGAPVPSWVAARVVASPRIGEVSPSTYARAISPPLVYPGAQGDLLMPDSGRGLAAPILGGGIRRAANALAEQDLRLLTRPSGDPDTRLLTRRDVGERVARMAPIFEQAGEATPLFAADSLFWALPLYTSVRTYPLSHHWNTGAGTTKYFRHAATALVNASTGLVRLVPTADPEPVTLAWMHQFPNIFVDVTRLDPDVANALPLPEAAIRAQAFAFGVARPDEEGERPLVLPGAGNGDSIGTGVSSLPFAPPGSSVLARAIPLLEPRTERVRAALVVAGGAGSTVTLARFNEDSPSWLDMTEQLQRELGRGASPSGDAPMIRSLAQFIPMRDGPALVQPAYTWRADGLPTLARVAVVRGDSVAVAGSLAALGRTGLGAGGDGARDATDTLSGAVAALYEQMRDALQRTDWEAFGRAFDALGDLIGAVPPPARQP